MSKGFLAVLIVIFLTVAAYSFCVSPSEYESENETHEASTIDLKSISERASEAVGKTSEVQPDEIDELATSNPAVRNVRQDIEKLMQDSVKSLLFSSGVPDTYIRHKILEIDAGAMRLQAEESLANWEDGQSVYAFQLPLFEDVVFDVMVQKWIPGNFGTHAAIGKIVASDVGLELTQSNGSVWISFSDSGPLEVTINTSDRNYLVKSPGGSSYYVVAELSAKSDNVVLD